MAKEMTDRIIINGDDFGISPGVNQAIEQLHRQGRLTSVSIMANMACSAEALAYAKAAPDLHVGVHFNLTTGRPLLPVEQVPSLVNSAGVFYKMHTLLPRMVAGLVRPEEMETELTAQMERCLDYGLKPHHVDTHQHLHALTTVGNLVAQLMDRYGVATVRNPDFSAFVVPPTGRNRLVQKKVRRTGKNVIRSTQEMIGRKSILLDGPANRSDQLVYLRSYVRRGDAALDSVRACFSDLDGRTLEIIAHPAVVDDVLPAFSNYVEGREQELEFLGSDRFFALLRDVKE
jgi:predicted glycoside hydrolase/deacetylase ChbG (UPF0249 family)